MNSPHTFFGKVTTLLIGSALCWLTVMNPEFRTAVDALLGERQRNSFTEDAMSVPLQPIDQGETDVNQPNVTTGSRNAPSNKAVLQEPSLNPKQHTEAEVRKISTQLRQLGASYLLLEKLPHPNGDQYRVRCDLADEASGVKCCFEATRESAVAAMNEVLQAILNVDSRHSDVTELVVSST